MGKPGMDLCALESHAVMDEPIHFLGGWGHCGPCPRLLMCHPLVRLSQGMEGALMGLAWLVGSF